MNNTISLDRCEKTVGPGRLERSECGVCSDEISATTNTMTHTDCGNVICTKCFTEWIKTQGVRAKCVYCRGNLSSEQQPLDTQVDQLLQTWVSSAVRNEADDTPAERADRARIRNRIRLLTREAYTQFTPTHDGTAQRVRGLLQTAGQTITEALVEDRASFEDYFFINHGDAAFSSAERYQQRIKRDIEARGAARTTELESRVEMPYEESLTTDSAEVLRRLRASKGSAWVSNHPDLASAIRAALREAKPSSLTTEVNQTLHHLSRTHGADWVTARPNLAKEIEKQREADHLVRRVRVREELKDADTSARRDARNSGRLLNVRPTPSESYLRLQERLTTEKEAKRLARAAKREEELEAVFTQFSASL